MTPNAEILSEYLSDRIQGIKKVNTVQTGFVTKGRLVR